MSDKLKKTNEQINLQDDFPHPTFEEWYRITEKILKGLPYEKLITKSYEGIALKPIYWPEDAKDLPHKEFLAGFPPYVRGKKSLGHVIDTWKICQELPYADPEEFNQAARYDLKRGQTGLNISLDQATRAGKDCDESNPKEVGCVGLSLSCIADLAKAFENIDLEQIPIFIPAETTALPIATLLAALMKQQNKSLDKVHGSLGADPLGVLVGKGSLTQTLENAYDQMAQLTQWAKENAPYLQTILIEANSYHEGGGSAVQELSFALATGVEYIRQMQLVGLTIDEIAPRISFSFSIGSNFFMEIAKLRSARILWAKIISAFAGDEEAQKMTIHARTSRWNKTSYDPYANMLRVTTEALAAVIAGCDSLHVGSFDEILRQPDEFSRRIARNVQLILKEECNLYRLVDPPGGSWYIENLTDSVGRKAWPLFQEVEQKGGMFKALQEGFPQAQITATAEKRASKIACRQDKFIGTNVYPNLKEKPLKIKPIDYEALYQKRCDQLADYRKVIDQNKYKSTLEKFDPKNPIETGIEAVLAGATLGDLTQKLRSKDGKIPAIEPIRIHRGAEFFESMRKKVEIFAEKRGSSPQLFLANMGPVSQHKARADFSREFFEVGGFEVIGNQAFETVEEAANAAINSGAPIVVICSTDPTYPEIVPPLTEQIKKANPETIVILAGYPKDQIKMHKEAGIDDFIHLKANVYEILKHCLNKLNII